MQSGWMIPPDVVRMLVDAIPRRLEPANPTMRAFYSMMERGPMYADIITGWYRWLPGANGAMTLHVCSDRPDLDIVKTLRAVSSVFRNVFPVKYMCMQLDASFGRSMYSGCIVWGDRLEKNTFQYRILKRFQENLSASFYVERALIAPRNKYLGTVLDEIMRDRRHYQATQQTWVTSESNKEIKAAARIVQHIIMMMRHGFRPPAINTHADVSSRVLARIMVTLYERYIRDSSGIFVLHLVHYGYPMIPDDVNVSIRIGRHLLIDDATKISDDDRDSFVPGLNGTGGILDFSSLYPSIIMHPDRPIYGGVNVEQAIARGIRITAPAVMPADLHMLRPFAGMPAGAFTPFTTEQGRHVMREAAARLRRDNINVTYGDTIETPESERVGMVKPLTMYAGSPLLADHDGDEMTRAPSGRPATAADLGVGGKRAEKRSRKDRHLTRGKGKHPTHGKQK